MIYAQLTTLFVLLLLCGAVAFLCLRTWNLIDQVKRDISRSDLESASAAKVSLEAKEAWVHMETTHYTRLAGRVAVIEGLVEGHNQKTEALISSVEQLHKKFGSWSRTESRTPREPAKDVERPTVERPLVLDDATLHRLADEGQAMPLSTSTRPKPGQSIRNRQ